MKTQCQVHPGCPEKPKILLISSCIQQHLNETRTCQTHLNILAQLSHQNKLYCHCGKPVIAALYKYRTTTRKLNEEPPWPDNPKST